MNRINYQRLSDAICYYESRGYVYREEYWTVGQRALDVTRPPDATRFPLASLGGYLVASGEQSFIQSMMHTDLHPGRYVCCTPCFRDEPVLDEYRFNYFMKVELISAWPNKEYEELRHMIYDAYHFFSRYVPAKVVKTAEGYDIEAHGVELGSYGIRQHKDLRWVYGTGVAEPRLSQVIQKNGDLKWDKEVLNLQIYDMLN